MSDVKPIPDGHPTVIPHLAVSNGAKAIEFYQKAFGAEVAFRSDLPDGRVLHAELRIGGHPVFVADEFQGSSTPGAVTIHLWTEDADSAWRRALDAGAEVRMPLMDAFWGDRYGSLKDPFGHSWAIGQRLENLSEKEMQKRALEWFSKMGG
jgi:uncharacterized glyoxalase superfamily protein PhnB